MSEQLKEPEKKPDQGGGGSTSAIDALIVDLESSGDMPKVETAGEHAGEKGKSLSEYIPVEKLLSMAISMTCSMLKPLKKYNVTDGDAESLGNAWGPVLERYMPNVPEGPLTNALMVTGIVIGSKVAAAKKAEKQKKPKEEVIQEKEIKVGNTNIKVKLEKPTLQPMSSRKNNNE